jgi:hypothetical protein
MPERRQNGRSTCWLHGVISMSTSVTASLTASPLAAIPCSGCLLSQGSRPDKHILLTKSYLGPEIATAVHKPQRLMRAGFLTRLISILWNRAFSRFGSAPANVLQRTEGAKKGCNPNARPGQLALDFRFYAGAAFVAVDQLGQPSKGGVGLVFRPPTPRLTDGWRVIPCDSYLFVKHRPAVGNR